MQPEGLRESSRWSERSEDHRCRVIPTCTLKGCQTSLRILHPRVLLLFPCFPVVFSRHVGIRPPATLYQPFGLRVSGESTI